MAALPKDETVSIQPMFTIPEGKMDDFKRVLAQFYESTKKGTKETIFYGFAQCGDKFVCRESYVSVDGALQHLEDVHDAIDATMGIIGGPEKLELKVIARKEAIEKLKPALAPLGATFWELQDEAFLMNTTFKK